MARRLALLQHDVSTTLRIIIVICCAQSILSDCPRLCECKWKNGKESVICLNANLSSIPTELDAGTQVIDLTGNNLINLKQDEFSNAGLVNLQRIYLSKCKLKSIDRFGFRNLINLIELDLSYNTLPVVPSHIFDSIPELRDLKLNGNPIQRIMNDAFIKLPQLVRLELSECKIGTLEARAFSGLEDSLSLLKLDGNRLVEVRSNTLTSLHNLQGLHLTGNPWNCTCSLRPLREWMLKKNMPYGIPPVCKFPSRLASKTWDKLDLDEFACVPKILAPDPKAHGVEGRNITMSCHIDGVPEPNVRWLLKNKVIANLSGIPSSNGKKLYVVHLHNNSSNLTILTADVQDAGVYVCAAENKAGRVEASVTLAVSRKPPEGTLNNKAVVAGIIVATLFVIAFCLIVLCVCSVRRRQQSARWQNRRTASGRRHEENYEKIEMNHVKLSSETNNGGNGVGPPHIGGDVALVGEHRRNGEYRGVPCLDSEQEVEEDEEVGYEDNIETPTPTSNLNNSREAKLWTSAASGRNIGSPNNGHWNSSLCDSSLDPEDLHIPRRTKEETRDDCNKTRNSTFGTYKTTSNGKKKLPIPSTITGGLSQTIQPHVMRKQVLNDTGSSLYTTAPSSDYERLVTPESDRQFPDLLDPGPVKYTSDCVSNTLTFNNNNLLLYKSCGSVDNIDKSLYCTLPKKKLRARYQSTDSQSPLLPSSRYGSSGGESYGSSRGSTRRLSDDTFRYPPSNINNRVYQKSSSYLNLVSATTPRTNNPSHKNLDSTPLLDVTGLESRLQERDSLLSPTNSTLTTSYDYHAAQLERFLEEYRTLQKQLCKMKETCENLSQIQDNKSLSNSRFLDPLLHNNVITPTSSSEDGNPKSILKKSPASLTPSSSSPASSGILSPLSTSHWSNRGPQKRFEGGYYKS